MSDTSSAMPSGSLGPAARAAGLAGVEVRGSDGDFVGRVREIYLGDRDNLLAALTVTRGRWSTATVLIPIDAVDGGAAAAIGIRLPDGSLLGPVAHPPHRDHTDPLTLLVTADVARAGIEPPDTGHVSPQQLADAARALGLDPAAAVPAGAPADSRGPATRPVTGSRPRIGEV